ncbi:MULTISPECIES: transglutaminase-like domain-containing protein [Blautia]|uniref:transglutaminase-like domain-containing protein n=1 Tax=Blautia TaxID=572511 RepID=UPI001570B87B|nr:MULTISPECIES: transglutaminase-like domain-containing protein [Blautia]MCQ4800250.1 transglutaminase-like domain-containing protein [Blautia sp. MSK.18.38]
MSKFLPVRLFFVWLLFGILLAGCGNSPSSDEEPPVYSPARVLTPEAPGKKTLGNSPLILDISNQDQGYLTAESDSDDSRMNIQLTAPSGVVYSYFLEPDEQTVLPFSEGSGEYLITCYQQIDGNQYAALYTETLTIKLQNEFLPFLYPNQYVDFSSKSEACKLAASLVKEDMTDIDILKTFYTYVTSHISYDYDKADSVEAGYLPDIDDTLSTGTGICFDYAALTTAMLRSQDIPCKLQIGYSGDVKHAWIDVYIRGSGWVTKAVSFDGDTWKLMDPTFDANSDGDEAIQEYIGDESNYTVQFTR